MTFYFNRVQISGKVGKDLAVKTFDDGGKLANFSLATSSFWKTKSGEKKESTQWHNVTIKNENLIGILQNKVVKGADVFVEGELQYRKYNDKSGIEKIFTEIVIAGYNGTVQVLNKQTKDASPDNIFEDTKTPKKKDPDEIPF